MSRKLRIGVNLRIGNLPVFDGNSAVMRSIARALSVCSSGHQIDLIVDAPPALPLPPEGSADFHVIRPFPAFNRLLRRAFGGDPWYRLRLPLDRRWRNLDAYVCNAHEEPPVIHGPPRIPIVHDLAFMLDEAESYFSRAHIDYLDWCTSANVHAAARIVAVSETTARDVIRTYGVPAGIVRVLLNSHDDAVFNANIDEDNVAATLAELDIRGPFFLHVGTIQPRKNLPTVIRAFKAFAAGGGDHQLLLVGAQGWRAENAADTGLPDLDSVKGVRLLGSLATEQIAHIMTAADALVMAGFYEGFGLPALEAMACGTPVLAANAGALPEVVGDAGLLFDPNDPDELTALMARIASDPDRRSQLGRRALARAAEFSRDSQARGLIELAEEIA